MITIYRYWELPIILPVILPIIKYLPIMLTVNWNCYHYYQKISKGPGAPGFVEGGRLCHGTMASPSLILVSGEAILSVENSGKPLGGQGSARTPLGR